MNPDFLTKGTLVDLTHDYSNETIYWPAENGFDF